MSDAAIHQTEDHAENWQEIEQLVDQLATLSRQEVSSNEFHAQLIRGAVKAANAVAGAVWLRETTGEFNLTQQVNTSSAIDLNSAASLAHRHPLVRRCAESQAVDAVFPSSQSGVTSGDSTYPLLLYCPVVLQQHTVGILELLLDDQSSRETQRASQQLLEVLADLAADFHANWQLRRMRDRELLWVDYDQFLSRIHQPLDLSTSCYTIANEARRLIDCDRVSVLTVRGRRCRLQCISGLDTVDRRSSVVREMESAARRVVLSGDAAWIPDDSDNASDERPSSIIECYQAASPSRQLGMIPLTPPTPSDGSNPRPIGVLVVEQFDDDRQLERTQQRAESVARHAAIALQNARRVTQLSSLPAQQIFNAAFFVMRLKNLPIAVISALMATLLALGLVFIRTDFVVEARGELVPVTAAMVFAPYDGTIDELTFLDVLERPDRPSDGITVSAGDLLLRMRSPDLDYELTTVLGEKDTTQKQLETISTTRNRMASRRRGPEEEDEYNELTAKIAELNVHVQTLDKRLAILRSQKQELSVRSQIDGQIQTWDAVRKLAARPVRRGQKLLTIVDPDGLWNLELQVPDHDMGYVLAAQQDLENPLAVTYILMSEPDLQQTGQIDQIAAATTVDPVDGAFVLVRVAVDTSSLATDLRPGTTVIGKIHCGRRPLGYVWLHDLVEFVRSRVFF